jgi:hypothetical protein
MSEYSEKLKDPRWQRKRLKIFERDGWACRDCGAADKPLHPHHCYYKGDPWEVPDELILTVCEDCHIDRGLLETEGKLMLGKIFAKLPNNSKTEENLMHFVSHLVKAVTAMDRRFLPDKPLVVRAHEYEWDSNGRWLSYAWEHPEARKFYEAVTGEIIPIEWLRPRIEFNPLL